MMLVGSSETVLREQRRGLVSWLTSRRRQEGVEQPELITPKGKESLVQKQDNTPKDNRKGQGDQNEIKEHQSLLRP
jgi:hypothetical protein